MISQLEILLLLYRLLIVGGILSRKHRPSIKLIVCYLSIHNTWPDFRKWTTLSHLIPEVFMAEKVFNISISKHSISLYHELPDILWNHLIATFVLLWQQGTIPGSIYFTHDKVVDFPKFSHIYNLNNVIPFRPTDSMQCVLW